MDETDQLISTLFDGEGFPGDAHPAGEPKDTPGADRDPVAGSDTPTPEGSRGGVRSHVIQQVSASTAHEMNNVLATIMGLASVISAEVDPESLLFQDAQDILAAARRGLSLTRSLLTFAQGNNLRKRPFSLNRLVGKTRSLLHQTLPASVSVQMDLDSDLRAVEGDADQLQHALFILTTRASDAMRGRGTLCLKTRNVVIEEKGQPAELSPGKYVRLQVIDTGEGMDPEDVERAFDPLSNPTPPGTTVAVGLPLVLKTIESHHGKVSIVSKKGLGTTVTMHLPALAAEVQGEEAPGRFGAQVRPLDETVLVLDDEEPFLMSTKRLLKKLGYKVHLTATGPDAIAYYREHHEEISVVMVDLIMPEMDGTEVFAALKAINAGVRVIFATGYVTTKVKEAILGMGAAAFIQKPFTLEQLEGTLKASSRKGSGSR